MIPVLVARGWDGAQDGPMSQPDGQIGLDSGWDQDMLRLELDGLRRRRLRSFQVGL